MRAVISVVGKDRVGILAMVSGICAKANANILEVTQSVLQEFFVMIMVIDISNMNRSLSDLRRELEENSMGMKIHVMHEDIFHSMHRV
ncbi:MAG: ACT domain-containing protein [Anaerovoracaceae bacterium]|jgi:ACT domain-containing protein|nr:ACT domain-containing protein [Clostridiales bacterium UBA9856]HOA43049.1 ACT domain-containing protein [Bacillota bacterium]HPZ59805.1 ACT domain-containing protein [Bacillota bacterium]HQC81896.1 ACT domain-containing protein [Bacillota bacterium]